MPIDEELLAFVASLAIPESRKAALLTELLDHAALARADALASGLSPEEADRLARQRLGTLDRAAFERANGAFEFSRRTALRDGAKLGALFSAAQILAIAGWRALGVLFYLVLFDSRGFARNAGFLEVLLYAIPLQLAIGGLEIFALLAVARRWMPSHLPQRFARGARGSVAIFFALALVAPFLAMLFVPQLDLQAITGNLPFPYSTLGIGSGDEEALMLMQLGLIPWVILTGALLLSAIRSAFVAADE